MPDANEHLGGIDRRTVLKGAAASGLGAAALGGGTASAAADERPELYEIGVFVTTRLARRCTAEHGDPWVAQKRAKTYLEGAFSRIEPKVDVITPRIPAPTDRHRIQGDYETTSVCDHHETTTYPHLLAWFRDWLEADCTAWRTAAHSNILLTDGHNHGGGLGYGQGRYAVAASGRFVARLPAEYQPYGYPDDDPSIGAMWVTLHEIGHNLVTHDPDNDADGDGVGHHDMARMYQHPEGNTNTAMGMHGDVNNCGTTFDKSTLEGRELTYSECAVSNFKPGFRPGDDGWVREARESSADNPSVVCTNGPPE